MPMVKPAWLTLIIYSFQGLWNTGSSTFIYSEELKTRKLRNRTGADGGYGSFRRKRGIVIHDDGSADHGVHGIAEQDHRDDGHKRYEGLRRSYEKNDKNTDVYVVGAMIFANVISAVTPYSTYTYSVDGVVIESPDAYVPDAIVDSEYIGKDEDL